MTPGTTPTVDADLPPLDVAEGHPGREKGTLTGWIQDLVFTVDHKKLGLMYICSGLIFMVIAGIMASLIRIQLAVPRNTFLEPDVFNRLFTMHGTAMVFLVGMPIILGAANYLVPLMVGARDMAFPRLNAFGFWIFLFSGLLLYFSYLGAPGLYDAGSAPDVGWFAYAPLTSKAFSRGHSTDYWTLSILLGGIGSIATSINIVVTVFCMRCKGMKLMRMPLYVWLMVVVAGMIIIAMPPLSACQIMLILDRYLGAKFFDTQAGGDAVLWQHFFWIFGHPEVYILMLPGFAMVSEIVPVFSRKPIFGYPVMVAATVMIAFISMGVWAHHMFCVGMTSLGNTFFATSTLLVAVPTGIKIFNWLGTMYGGKLRMEVPMLFAIAFLFQFLCAGPDRSDAGRGALQLAIERFLFCGGPLPLRADRRPCFHDFCRGLLLVSQGHGPDAQQQAGPLAFLAVFDRVQRNVWSPAYRGNPGNAPAYLHV